MFSSSRCLGFSIMMFPGTFVVGVTIVVVSLGRLVPDVYPLARVPRRRLREATVETLPDWPRQLAADGPALHRQPAAPTQRINRNDQQDLLGTG